MTPLFWLRYASRSLWRSGRRSAVALLCIAVGVAGVVALQTASLTVQSALTSNVRAANGGDISVVSRTAPLSKADLGFFSRLQTQGRLTTWTAVTTVHATAVGTKGHLVPFDVDIVQAPPYPVGGEPTFVSPSNGKVSRLLAGHGDVLVSAVLAQELGVGVGGRLFVNGLGGSGLHATVRGVLSETSFEHSAVMTVDRRDAAALSNHVPTYSQVYANVPAGNGSALTRSLRDRFPLATVSTVGDALQNAQLQVHDFRQFLLLVALFALLIAGVGILNAMQSILAWRRLEIAMLKAMGFGQGVLYALFGLEAVLLGLAGGVGGTAVGAVASKAITDALARALAIQVNFRLDALTLVQGVLLGIGATLIFAVLPIARAAAYRPLEVLREGSGETASGWVRSLVLLAVVLVLFVFLAAIIVGDTTVAVQFAGGSFLTCAALAVIFWLAVTWMGRLGRPASTLMGGVVLVALLLVSAYLAKRIPSLAPVVLLGAAVWAATVFLPQGRLLSLLIAARTMSRRRSRTSITLVAFLAGVLAMAVTLTVALSLQGQINSALASEGNVNLVSVANPQDEHAVLHASRGLPGVTHVTDSALATTQAVSLKGQSLASTLGPAPPGTGDGDNERGRLFGGLTGYNIASGDGPSGITIVAGRALRASDAGTTNVLLRGALMEWPFAMRPGDRFVVKGTTSGVKRTLHVVGFYSRPRSSRGFGSFFVAPMLGDRSAAVALGGLDTQIVVSYVVAKNQLTHDAATIQSAVPSALVIDVGDLTAVVETILNELLNLLAVITALVLGAGIAVVANGVALAMFERRREIALYKAVGFGPGSVLRFVLIENALVGTMAGAVAVLATAITLGILSRVAFQRSVGFDPLIAIYVLVGATALAVATAYLAARKPVGMRPLEVLRNE